MQRYRIFPRGLLFLACPVELGLYIVKHNQGPVRFSESQCLAHINSGWVSSVVKVTEQTMQNRSQMSLGLFVRHDENRLEINGQAKPNQTQPSQLHCVSKKRH